MDVDFFLVDLAFGFGTERIEEVVGRALLFRKIDSRAGINHFLATRPLLFILRRFFNLHKCGFNISLVFVFD